jgi:hypothetical protein
MSFRFNVDKNFVVLVLSYYWHHFKFFVYALMLVLAEGRAGECWEIFSN